MESRAAWSAESRAALGAVAASAAALAALTGAGGADRTDPPGADRLQNADPLRDLADGCLDGLAEVARLEARTAALKVQLAADYARAARFLAPPAASPRDRAAQEMALVAEVACVLTVSERTAGALLVRLPGADDGAAADPGRAAGRDDLLAARPDPRRGNQRPGPCRGGRAGGALPGPRRAQPRPRLPGRGARAVPVPGQGPHLAGTPPPGQHRETPHREAPRTGGSSSSRTGTAWPGSRPSCRPTPRPGSGNGPPPPPAPCRARTRPGPWPSSAPTSPPPGSSPTAPAPPGPAEQPAAAPTAAAGPPAAAPARPGRAGAGGVPVAAGAGPGHRPGPVAAGRHGRTGRPGRVRADPAVDGPPPDRRRRRLLLPGPDRPPGRRPAGNRAEQLPSDDGAAALAPAPRRPVPVPRL